MFLSWILQSKDFERKLFNLIYVVYRIDSDFMAMNANVEIGFKERNYHLTCRMKRSGRIKTSCLAILKHKGYRYRNNRKKIQYLLTFLYDIFLPISKSLSSISPIMIVSTYMSTATSPPDFLCLFRRK